MRGQRPAAGLPGRAAGPGWPSATLRTRTPHAELHAARPDARPLPQGGARQPAARRPAPHPRASSRPPRPPLSRRRFPPAWPSSPSAPTRPALRTRAACPAPICTAAPAGARLVKRHSGGVSLDAAALARRAHALRTDCNHQASNIQRAAQAAAHGACVVIVPRPARSPPVARLLLQVLPHSRVLLDAGVAAAIQLVTAVAAVCARAPARRPGRAGAPSEQWAPTAARVRAAAPRVPAPRPVHAPLSAQAACALRQPWGGSGAGGGAPGRPLRCVQVVDKAAGTAAPRAKGAHRRRRRQRRRMR